MARMTWQLKGDAVVPSRTVGLLRSAAGGHVVIYVEWLGMVVQPG
jgi:hypothetical protein